MRWLGTFVAALIITSSMPAADTATGTSTTTELTADQAQLAAAALAAPQPQHQQLYPPAERSVRLAGATLIAAAKTVAQPVAQPVKTAKKTTTTATATTARRPVTKKKPAPPKVATPVKKKPAAAAAPPANGSRVDTVVGFALAQVGKPYVWAAAGPNAYDCSGLTMASYARVGIKLPHQSGGQAGAGRAVTRAQLQRGDLIVYSGHVAIALGGGKMVHAANSRTGVVIGTIYGSPTGYRRLL